MGAALDAVRLAVGTLTVVPVRAPVVVDRTVAGRAMLLAPLVAVLPALAGAVAVAAGRWAGVQPLVTGFVTVGVLALCSRGLHLDGLADTADGLAASHDRDRALAVMRTGDVGPAGAVTLLVVVGAQAAAVGALSAWASPWRGALCVAGAVVVSRSALTACCAAGVPSARSQGLGAAVAGSVPVAAAAGSVTAAVLVLVALGVGTGRPWWTGLLAAVVAALAGAALVVRCVRRLGGITGDVLGACVEVTLAGLLLVLSSAG